MGPFWADDVAELTFQHVLTWRQVTMWHAGGTCVVPFEGSTSFIIYICLMGDLA